MNLSELHDILYDIICEIDDACKAENVQYMLGGGTMLGAVREHDFIPWDDDADLCLWSKDYPAFRQAMLRHLPAYYRLVEPQDLKPNFYDFVCRIQDTRYFWHEPTAEDAVYGNMQNHVCVDLFLINEGADTLRGLRRRAFLQKVIYGLAMGHRVSRDLDKYSTLQRLQVGVLAGVGKHIDMDRIFRWKKALDQSGREGARYCEIGNDLPKYFGLPYERDWFEGTVRIPFRDRELPVQKGYDQKMTLQYGDYMSPPADRSDYISHLQAD